MLCLTAQMQRHIAVFHAEPARPNIQNRVAFACITLREHVEASGNGGFLQPLLPVVDPYAHAPTQRHAGERPVPAPIANVQLFSRNLPRQVKQRIGVIPRHHYQLALIVLPVKIGIDQRG